jgi:hypothetical protein
MPTSRLALTGLLLFALAACSPAPSPTPSLIPPTPPVPAATQPSPAPTLALRPPAGETLRPPVGETLRPPAGEAPTTTASPIPTLTLRPPAGETLTPAPTLTPSATLDTRRPPEKWQEWPPTPAVSARAKALYQAGLAKGNNPRAFSKIGDCQNITSHFLGPFDNPRMFKLGDKFAYLQPALEQFAGMFKRESAAVRPGYNVAAVLSPLQADPAVCKPGETPVSCELRLNKPSIVVISMETWWAKKPAAEYEKYMRQILDLVIAQQALPILATKADNLEGDHSVNATIARLAYEYDIPLWNFWKAVQPLPGKGLTEDGFHLSHGVDRPDDPLYYQRLSEPRAWDFGWTVRNVTALQALDAVWRAAGGQ